MATIESECAEVLCGISAEVQTTEDSSSCKNSCTSLQQFTGPENSGITAPSTTIASKRSGGAGGFTCCVPGCFTNNKRNPELSFYNFPNGKSRESVELRKKWINLISRKNFSPTTGHRVCSQHFPGGRKTYMNELPTLVPKANKPTPTNPRLTKKARNRTPLVSKSNLDKSTKCRLYTERNSDHDDGFLEGQHENTNSTNENVDPVVRLQEQMAELLATNEKLKMENERLKAEKEQQKTDIQLLREQLEDQLKGKHFSIDCFKTNDYLFRFYTGLHDYKTFKTLFNSFRPALKNLVYYGSKTNSARLTSDEVVKCGPKRSLSVEQEFFLVLVRLRLGLLEEYLATRAGLSQSQMSRIFITWTDFLHSRLRSYPVWPLRESVNKSMPTSFNEMYPSTRVFIDCTEIFIEMPSSFRSQSVTYSSYKHHNTAKGLVGVSPSGDFSFVSDLYTGRSSDRQITNDCRILSLLEDGDSIMEDGDFMLEDGDAIATKPWLFWANDKSTTSYINRWTFFKDFTFIFT